MLGARKWPETCGKARPAVGRVVEFYGPGQALQRAADRTYIDAAASDSG